MPAHDLSAEWTAEMAIALPADGNRYEVLDGELFVTPAPTLGHQAVVFELAQRVAAFVRDRSLGWMFLSPADIVLSPHRLVQPDLFVVPSSAGPRPREWTQVKELLLVVEVLSPSTALADRNRKRRIYQGEGVPEYWIVDLDAQLVERWRPGDSRPEIVSGLLEWAPRAGFEPLGIDLQALFESLRGDG